MRFTPVSWLASKDGPYGAGTLARHLASALASFLPGFPQWPEAVSSLTVARQRGISTRFPVLCVEQQTLRTERANALKAD